MIDMHSEGINFTVNEYEWHYLNVELYVYPKVKDINQCL